MARKLDCKLENVGGHVASRGFKKQKGTERLRGRQGGEDAGCLRGWKRCDAASCTLGGSLKQSRGRMTGVQARD